MKNTINITLLFLFISIFSNCSSSKNAVFKSKVLYKTSELVITQVSKKSFIHTSFLKTRSFGNVPCNGLIVIDKNEAIILDATTDNESSEKLINWVSANLHCEIKAIIPTHFHIDNLGGLKAFHNNKIPSYAYSKTIDFAKEKKEVVPENSFKMSHTFMVGSKKLILSFFGEGHTKDNIVGYFPSEKILFGGCLIKSLNAGKGNLADANPEAWSRTVEKIKNEYPKAKVIIPGHWKFGDTKLLDFTIEMFKVKK